MRPEAGDAEEKCPVDHRTREAWLQAAKANKNTPPPTFTPTKPTTSLPPPPPSRFSLDTFTWHSQSQQPPARKLRPLPTDREISSIPRAINNSSDPSTLNSAERAALPTNNEIETGHDASTGNWVYPSQSQFFSAMKRKGHVANPNDMSSIVPIHNAVNERAWSQILDWEKGWGAERCGGPKLVSFAGDSKRLTPKAYWNMWIKGYKEPFDRHDWVVERCGKKVEYVIDFYKGKEMEGMEAVPLSFFLDVRPKVNSWDGIKMRIARTFGI